MITSHSTILVGVQLTELLEEKLIETFGDDFECKLLENHDICILPYDRCIGCEALIGEIVCDIDETADNLYEEIKTKDLLISAEKMVQFFKSINVDPDVKIYNILHCV